LTQGYTPSIIYVMKKIIESKKEKWQCMLDTLEAVGDQLNSRTYRFIKGELICCAVEEATGMKYVDEVGYDLVDSEGIRYECRSQINTFYKTKDCTRRGIVLKNMLSSETNINTELGFDYLILVQSDVDDFRVAVVDRNVCESNLYQVDGQLKLNSIPVEHWVIGKGDLSTRNVDSIKLDLKPAFVKIIQSFS